MTAAYYDKLENVRCRCGLCPHYCVINDGETGLCGTRRNKDGVLTAENYGKITAMALDPIEKKPLRMFHPGCNLLSISSYGCNMKCPFCQNHTLSQLQDEAAEYEEYAPAEIAALAAHYKGRGCAGVAYTYNEPVTFYEFVKDTAALVREAGLINVLVTNGYINEAPLRELLPLMDALSVDVKSVREDFYKEAGGSLPPVKKTVELAVSSGVHVEVVYLVIDGVNDSDAEIDELTDWLASVDRTIPLHLTRFHPMYKWSGPGWRQTPAQTTARLAKLAGDRLPHVFM